MFTSYSVGAYTHSGSTIGGEFATLEQARAEFARLSARRDIASVALFGWTDDNCEELKTYCA